MNFLYFGIFSFHCIDCFTCMIPERWDIVQVMQFLPIDVPKLSFTEFGSKSAIKLYNYMHNVYKNQKDYVPVFHKLIWKPILYPFFCPLVYLIKMTTIPTNSSRKIICIQIVVFLCLPYPSSKHMPSFDFDKKIKMAAYMANVKTTMGQVFCIGNTMMGIMFQMHKSKMFFKCSVLMKGSTLYIYSRLSFVPDIRSI